MHLYDPTPAAVAALAELQTEERQLTVRYSTEAVAVPASWPGEAAFFRKIFYTSARFTLLSDLLQVYGRPILCLDIDALVVSDVRNFLDGLSGRDVVLSEGDWEAPPNRRLRAGFFFVRDTMFGRRFCETMRDYLHHFLYEDVPAYFIDQAALFSLYYRFRAQGLGDRMEIVPWQTVLDMVLFAGDAPSRADPPAPASSDTDPFADKAAALRAVQESRGLARV